MSTLSREDSPTAGYSNAILPQHFAAGGTSTKKTGEDNPLPTSDGSTQAKIDALNTKIDSLNSKIDAITGGTTPAVTTLSGSNTQIITNQTIAAGGNFSTSFQNVEDGRLLAFSLYPAAAANYSVEVAWSWDNNGVFLSEKIIVGTKFIGKALVKPKAPFVKFTVRNLGGSSLTFNGWLTKLPNTGQQEILDMNPLITSQTCASASTNYDIDVNGTYGRNAKNGFFKANKNNVGEVSVSISCDGTTFSTFLDQIDAGDVVTLNDENISKIRVKSTAVNDSINVWVR